MDGMLSQDEINALLSGVGDANAADGSDTGTSAGTEQEAAEELLTAAEKDAVGEVANISMGSSATTLYSLVSRKVNITTPVVDLVTWENILEFYERPCVFIQIKYTAGLDGSNILILKEQDVKVITDLMMGGDGTNTDEELGELHLSAISEAMNQMMGAAATSLSTMLGFLIDISPPKADLINLNETDIENELANFLKGTFVRISFSMQIEGLVDSTILQLYPVDFAKSLYDTFINQQPETVKTQIKEPQPVAMQPQPDQQAQMNMQGAMPQMGMPQQGMDQMYMQQGMPQMNMQGMMPQMNMQGMMPQMGMPQNVNVQPAQFQNFSANYTAMPSQENIGLIMDVPLEVTVELGRCIKSISEILDFSPGTIIELDKIAGEPVDVLVNGKFVAKGEVVVIEENFSIRVTEIIK